MSFAWFMEWESGKMGNYMQMFWTLELNR